MQNLIGTQLGNYRLIRLLGRGGFAEVYLGEHIHLHNHAAIKVLHTQLATNDVENFQNEALTIARLMHPHIVRVFDYDIAQDIPFLVMDYAPNGTLRQRHPKGSRLPIEIIISYVKQVSEALQYAHEQKVIHRDIKPENMLVGRHHEILLSDFGIATMAQSSRYQNTGGMIGTVAYMAPEQIQGKARPASDQYALGVVVYEWLSGDRPFHGSFTEIAVQHAVASPQPLHDRVPISPSIEHVVMTALEKNAQSRFANVQTFANALEQASLQDSAPTFVRPTEVHLLDQFPQPTIVPSPLRQPPQATLAVPYPGGQEKTTSASTLSSSSVPASTPKKWRLWLVLVGVLVLVIASSVVYFVHNSASTGNFQSKTSVAGQTNQTSTSSTTSTSTSVSSPGQIHIFDAARVLDVAQVQNEAATLPHPIDIYTTSTFTGSNSEFDQETRAKLGNNADLIVIAIDTVHHHMAIVRGANVPLSSSQLQSAISAFASNYGNGDYTAATIAAIRSLRSSLGGVSLIQDLEVI